MICSFLRMFCNVSRIRSRVSLFYSRLLAVSVGTDDLLASDENTSFPESACSKAIRRLYTF